MAISSNAVIHFTDSIQKLNGILTSGFQVKYCLETNHVKSGEISAAIPMVSFCDIPLSEIKDHISKYGCYGIGLKKEWAILNGLNPVLYIDNHSNLGQNLRSAIMSFSKRAEGGWTEDQKKLVDVARFIKNYQHDLKRNGQDIKNYRFYDEREWRYVPPIDSGLQLIVNPKSYKSSEVKEKYNSEASKLKLTFKPSDISYIILKDEAEISDFIDFLKRVYKKSTLEEVDILVTRILTVEQINFDF